MDYGFPNDFHKVYDLFLDLQSLFYTNNSSKKIFSSKLKAVQMKSESITSLKSEPLENLLDCITNNKFGHGFTQKLKEAFEDVKKFLLSEGQKKFNPFKFGDLKEDMELLILDKNVMNNFTLKKDEKKEVEKDGKKETKKTKLSQLISFPYGLDPLEATKYLLDLLLSYVKDHSFWDVDGQFNFTAFIKSYKWRSFKENSIILQYVNFNILDSESVIPFYIYLYNIISIDRFISRKSFKYTYNGVYKVGGSLIHIDMITERLSKHDRLLLCDFTNSCMKPEIFDISRKDILINYLRDVLEFDNDQNFITLPHSFLSQKICSIENPKDGIDILLELNIIPKGNWGLKYVPKSESFSCVLSLEELEHIDEEKRLKGELTDHLGNIYNGQYTKHEETSFRMGFGTMNYKNGDKYYGEWKNDKKHGFGFFYKGTSLYCGEFYEGKKYGKGIEFDENGLFFTGHYKDDKRNGKGSLYFQNGEIHGTWFDNDINNATFGRSDEDEKSKKKMFIEKWRIMYQNHHAFFDKKKKIFKKSSKYFSLLQNKKLYEGTMEEYNQIRKSVKNEFSSDLLDSFINKYKDSKYEILDKMKIDLNRYLIQFFTYFTWRYQVSKKSISPKLLKFEAKEDINSFLSFLSDKVRYIVEDSIHIDEIKEYFHHYIISSIYDTYFNLYKLNFKDKDMILENQGSLLKNLPSSKIGVDQTYDSSYSSAIEEISKISSYKSVIEKLECLEKMEVKYFNIIHQIQESFHKKIKDKVLGTDSLLPIQIYIYLKSLFSNKWSELQFLYDHYEIYSKKFLYKYNISEKVPKRLADMEISFKYLLIVDYHVFDKENILLPSSSIIKNLISLIGDYDKKSIEWILSFLSDLYNQVEWEDIEKKYNDKISQNVDFFVKFTQDLFINFDKKNFKLSFHVKLPPNIYSDISLKLIEIFH